jgi:hypothetical protein
MNAHLLTVQVSLRYRVAPSDHSVSNHPLPSRCAVWRFLTIGLTGGLASSASRALAGRASFGLRLWLAGSPRQQAESSLRRLTGVNLCYGLVVRLRLLPTPPHGDAVTVGYRGARRTPARTCTSLIQRTYRRTSPPLRGGRAATERRATLGPRFRGGLRREAAGRLFLLGCTT